MTRPLDAEFVETIYDELSFWSSRFGALLFDHLELRRGIRGLDVACGAGFPLLELAHVHGESSHLTGVDIWKEALEKVLGIVRKVAKSNTTVLVRGETGTGKELIAGAVHHNSHRAARNFIKVNCAALQENLLESELFGHEKGAFTGADKQRIGRFEQADGGTLFLDEIGDMSANTQAKILRVLQEHEFERLGGTRTIKVDVRLIAATNRELTTMVEAGHFREDLFYRLNVVTVELPPLRARGDDVVLLARHFAERFSREFKKPIASIDDAAVARLRQHSWPGNVRELRNVLERMVIATDAPVLGGSAVPVDLRSGESVGPMAGTYAAQKAEAERQIVISALERNEWSLTRTAKQLGLADHASLSKIMRRLGIERNKS